MLEILILNDSVCICHPWNDALHYTLHFCTLLDGKYSNIRHNMINFSLDPTTLPNFIFAK